MGKDIRDYIDQELDLPEINADACVHSYFNHSDCQACVDSCPSQAWILNEDSLGLNTDACDGCGRCIPACPGGALSVKYPWAVRRFKKQTIALFACEFSNIVKKSSALPCVHILGLRQLLLLYNFGARYLIIATNECQECDRYPATGIQQQLHDLNRLLADRNKPPMKVLRGSDEIWEKIYNSGRVEAKGNKLSRRNFLRAKGKPYRHQFLLDDPLNLPESQTIPPGQLLPTANKSILLWPWVPQLDESLCNCCDACMNLCPTEAIQFTPAEDGRPHEYHLDPAKCNGCGICEGVCDLKAISIHSLSPSTISTIKLREEQCSACGNVFHFTQQTSIGSEQALCRICRKENHSKMLFQVME